MKRTLIFAVGLILLTGCTTRRQMQTEIDLLERELRLQEDKIYELEDCVRDYQDALKACRMGQNQPASLDAEDRDDSEAPSFSRPTFDEPSLPDPSTLEAPSVELPGEPVPEGQLPDTLRVPDVPERLKGPSLDEVPSAGRAIQRTSYTVGQQTVGGLSLYASEVGGLDVDDKPGDEGVGVVLELRDEHDKLVEVPGEASIVVLDPVLPGEEARVARWDFSESETYANGLCFEMEWPGEPPRHKNLHMFVRYTTDDGRQLQIDGPLQVALLPEIKARWTADPEAGWTASANPTPRPRIAPEPVESRPIPTTPIAVERPVERPTPRPIAVRPTPPPKPAPKKPARPVWSPTRPVSR